MTLGPCAVADLVHPVEASDESGLATAGGTYDCRYSIVFEWDGYVFQNLLGAETSAKVFDYKLAPHIVQSKLEPG